LIEVIKNSVNKKNYSWRILEREAPGNQIKKHTSIIGKMIPDLLVFKPTIIPDPDQDLLLLLD
jgi:hypothetical protein